MMSAVSAVAEHLGLDQLRVILEGADAGGLDVGGEQLHRAAHRVQVQRRVAPVNMDARYP